MAKKQKKEEAKKQRKPRAKKLEKHQWYMLDVVGQGDSSNAGTLPEDINKIVEPDNKLVGEQLNLIMKEKVKLLCQAGNPDAALEYVKEYEGLTESYEAQKNVFRRDKSTGAPFLGAHMVQSAIVNAAVASFWQEFNINKKGINSTGVGKDHFRRQINIRPFHIFFHRPDMSNGYLLDVDSVEGQQPTTGVRGFQRHEMIHPPFQFKFTAYVDYRESFPQLKNTDLVLELLHRAAWHGLGAKRPMGCGAWHIVSVVKREPAGDATIIL